MGWFFGFEAENAEVLHGPGPLLLVPNHVSWFDWLFLWVLLEDDWRFVTSSTTAQASPIHRALMINRWTFPIDVASPYAVKRMAEHLSKGGKLVLFAEGRLSLTGVLMKLFEGTGFLLHKTKSPVVTCFLRGANRLPFSRHQNKAEFFPTVTAHFSQRLTAPLFEALKTSLARPRITAWLRDRMVEQQFEVEHRVGPKTILLALVDVAQRYGGKTILEDPTGQNLNYRKLLAGADLIFRRLRPRLLPGQDRVGVLLPNVNATPVVLIALWVCGRIPAVLNFTTGPATMRACTELAGLKQIITSRQFVAKARLDLSWIHLTGVEVIYLEDVREGIPRGEKIGALISQWFRPSLPPTFIGADQTAVVLFTSGSEGVPKGVELSHANILANVRQMLGVMDLEDNDRVFNCLPLFHSFGLVVGLFLPLLRGLYTYLYPSPLHYRMVPSALYDRACTVFLSTNTFLNGYARKANAYDFRSVRYLFAAAEKLQEATATTWARKFGVVAREGYGATECSPALALNTPLQPKEGTVGKLMPGIEYKLEPVEGVAEGGRLLVRGPNMMKGYLNADANEKFKALGGWYDTGDIVTVDDEGYVQIRGRLKRFAKVSGEMVSLTAVEDALAGAFPHYGLRCQLAVVTRPDEDRGEVLIAVSNESRLTLEEIRSVLRARGLNNLSVPREIRVVREIPKLGTGKIDHRKLSERLAAEPAT